MPFCFGRPVVGWFCRTLDVLVRFRARRPSTAMPVRSFAGSSSAATVFHHVVEGVEYKVPLAPSKTVANRVPTLRNCDDSRDRVRDSPPCPDRKRPAVMMSSVSRKAPATLDEPEKHRVGTRRTAPNAATAQPAEHPAVRTPDRPPNTLVRSNPSRDAWPFSGGIMAGRCWHLRPLSRHPSGFTWPGVGFPGWCRALPGVRWGSRA